MLLIAALQRTSLNFRLWPAADIGSATAGGVETVMSWRRERDSNSRMLAVKRFHDPKPCDELPFGIDGRSAYQFLDCQLPFRLVVLALRQLLDMSAGIAKRDQLTAAGQWDRLVELFDPEVGAAARCSVITSSACQCRDPTRARYQPRRVCRNWWIESAG
jgi:hypothetical protein